MTAGSIATKARQLPGSKTRRETSCRLSKSRRSPITVAADRFPRLLQTGLDTTDARALAEFYRELLGLQYRPGDEPPAVGEPDPLGQDWLVLQDAAGRRLLAFPQ